MSYTQALRDEEKNKEIIYASFDSAVQRLAVTETKAEEYYESGSYDDQSAFMAASPMWQASRERQAKQRQVKELYERPYFAHICLKEEDTGDAVDCFLSDNPSLDHRLGVDGAPNMHIIPFKQDNERPFFSAAFHCYQAKTEEKIPVRGYSKHTGEFEKAYLPELVRDVDVRQRVLHDVITYLPMDSSVAKVSADEYLEKKLEENRSNPQLQNIIATLQQQQFQIIRTDHKESFVVQGCAGSGKTQCLIHRLFYLRDILKENGWKNVLLITPTQLFRNYSAALMRRYHLDTVTNTSISGLYKSLLEIYDPRFTDRQYKYEMTEEYLPDSYLQQVYAPAQLKRIDAEIERAIHAYIAEASRLTGIKVSALDTSFATVEMLAKELTDIIERFDETEKALVGDKEFQSHRAEMEQLEKRLNTLKKDMSALQTTRKQLEHERELFDQLNDAFEEANAELQKENDKVGYESSQLLDKLNACVSKLDKCKEPRQYYALLAAYAEIHDKVLQLTAGSEELKAAHQYREFLAGIVEEQRAALTLFTKDLTPNKWLNRHNRSVEKNTKRIADLNDEIDLANMYISDHAKWISEHNGDSTANQRLAYRSELERARYFLTRIESSVFEREVWNALAPLKTQCGIQTIDTETLENGRQKHSRILYKSDLLFYLHIYYALHGIPADMPKYDPICIDEGQDLHWADYDMLRCLFPKAAFNVFGDTTQVLHSACGISDWKHETGIKTVYTINNNYRNAAAITDFCNKRFGSKMICTGKIHPEHAPTVLTSVSQITEETLSNNAVIIVQNKEMYESLCAGIRNTDIKSKLAFIDTRAQSIPEDVIPCYSIFAAKGLEFSNVLVYAKGMTKNQRVVACTRAMGKLNYLDY